MVDKNAQFLFPSVTLLMLFNLRVLFYFFLEQVENETVDDTIIIASYYYFLSTEKGGVG